MAVPVLVLLSLALAAHAEFPTVFINNVRMETSEPQNSSIIATYEFIENELTNVKCKGPRAGMMTFTVKDESKLMGYIKTNYTEMLMRIRVESDGKYIDCHHNSAGVESIVRIMLKLKPIDIDKDKQLPENKPSLCCTAPKSQCSSAFIKNNVSGLIGLDSSRILYIYCNSMDYQEIHYEYRDEQSLNLMWEVGLIAGTSHEFTVLWKDKLITSIPLIKVLNNCITSINIVPIIPVLGDDGSVIKFRTSLTSLIDNKQSHEEFRIILRGKGINDTNSEQGKGDNKAYYLLAGMFFVLLMILIAGIWLTLNKKSKMPNAAVVDRNYENLENETSINPFPSQWDTYANAMERRDPDMNSMKRLYATPVRKSQRRGEQHDTYMNVGGDSTLPVSEGLYSVAQEIRASAEPEPCGKEHNTINVMK